MGKEKDNIVDTSIGDPDKMSSQDRKLYVGQVAGLHKDILKPKFEAMISNCHFLLENPDNSSDLDKVLKGAIYSFRELILWGETMLSEQVANQRGEDLSTAKDK